jgi:hypothetical protein
MGARSRLLQSFAYMHCAFEREGLCMRTRRLVHVHVREGVRACARNSFVHVCGSACVRCVFVCVKRLQISDYLVS